jgi:hypothetical protein
VGGDQVLKEVKWTGGAFSGWRAIAKEFASHGGTLLVIISCWMWARQPSTNIVAIMIDNKTLGNVSCDAQGRTTPFYESVTRQFLSPGLAAGQHKLEVKAEEANCGPNDWFDATVLEFPF